MKAKLLALILVIAATGLAQTPKKELNPLDRVQVLALLAGGVHSQRVAILIEQRGIDFQPNDDYLKILQGAGADEVVLNALREARRIPTPAVAAPVLSRQQEVEQHLGRGAEFSKQKLYVKAKQEYETAVRLDPLNASPHSALGNALLDLQDWDGAITEYQIAVRLEPDSEWSYVGLGMSFQRKGDLDGAINAYHSALKLSEDVYIHNSLGDVLYAKGDADGAISEYRDTIRIVTDTFGKAHKIEGLRPEKLDQVLTLVWGPYLAHAHANLGVALAHKGDAGGAIAEYRRALELQPDDALLHANLGIALTRKGDIDAAIAELEAAKRLKPDDAWAIANLGLALEKKGAPTEPLQSIKNPST